MNLLDAYKEWCNCGNTGTFLEWALEVGISIEDLNKKEEET